MSKARYVVVGKVEKGPGFRVDVTAEAKPFKSRSRRRQEEKRKAEHDRKSAYSSHVLSMRFPLLADEHAGQRCHEICPIGMAVIYALVDPRDGTVRYVGKSIAPGDRLDRHLERPHSRRLFVWFKALRKRGLKPEMFGIDLVELAQWPDAERAAIAFYRARGDLLNIEDGGPRHG